MTKSQLIKDLEQKQILLESRIKEQELRINNLEKQLREFQIRLQNQMVI